MHDHELVADTGGDLVAVRLRELERPAGDADVPGHVGREVAELERRVAERLAEHVLDLLGRSLLRQLGDEPPSRRAEPRPEEAVQERERHQEKRGKRRPVDDFGGALGDKRGQVLHQHGSDQQARRREDGRKRAAQRR